MIADPQGVELSADSVESEGRATAFWLHVVAWLFFYLTVVVAWGQRNSWPADLLLCVLLLPMNVLVVSTLYTVERLALTIEPEKSQQEQLIASLVLAVGLASGQVLLMSLGLACLGIAWLRPAQPDVDWAEWLKIPVVLLTTLPFWVDFEGSGLPLAALFDDPAANPVFHLPLALEITQAQVLGYCGLVAMVLFLRGRAFWLALPCLPILLILITLLPRVFPTWLTMDPVLRAAVPWLLGIVALGVAPRVLRHIERASRHLVSGRTLRRWLEERRYPPWLAALVVAAMQAVPLDTVRVTMARILGWIGVGVLLFLLVRLRRRTPRGPIHSRSVAMVAGGLALTLLAEFTTSASLRHVALGLVMIGLISWHCFWPLRIFIVAALACVALLAGPEHLAVGLWDSSVAVVARMVIAFLLLGVLGGFMRQPLPIPGAHGYSDEGWVPPKRFALILLGLMMLFQTASAFWPEHDIDAVAVSASAEKETEALDPLQTLEPGWFRVASPRGSVQLMIAFPRKNPYLLESPERTLRRRGWRIVERVRVQRPSGEAVALGLERNGVRATAMWWFEVGDRVFSNHVYARRVLWSGWHLADRGLRLIRLESTTLREPQELIAIARREDWFSSMTATRP
jgi:hypothetical protein